MKSVFIDGSAGTTGLRIHQRLEVRGDIQLVTLPEEMRKDISARAQALNSADIVFLCLPDDAAREAVGLIENPDVCVIDTSTAHRTSPGWVYGFPELHGQREKIRASKRIANPGCHAGGMIALIAPLVESGLLPENARFACTSLTGYSGGGKKMIASYEEDERDPLLDAPRLYGLDQKHKHLPEVQAVCSLASPPLFLPIVAPYYAGMEVTLPLFVSDFTSPVTAREVEACYRSYYTSGVVRVRGNADENGFLSAGALTGRDDMEIAVFGNDERIVLTARFDNLGKGASGAAIQNMNLLLDVNETEGLIL